VRALVTLGDYYLQFEDWENAVKLYTGRGAAVCTAPGRVLGLAEARLELQRELSDSLAEVEALTPRTCRRRSAAARGRVRPVASSAAATKRRSRCSPPREQYREQAFEVELALASRTRGGQHGRGAARLRERGKARAEGQATTRKRPRRVLIARSASAS